MQLFGRIALLFLVISFISYFYYSSFPEWRIKQMVRKCSNTDDCFFQTDAVPKSAMNLDPEYVERYVCSKEGTLSIQKEEESSDAQLLYLTCRQGNKPVSRIIFSRIKRVGLSIEVFPYNDDAAFQNQQIPL
jgi:hypothetical protein